MSGARATVDVPRRADDVWRLVGGFGSLPDWLPSIVDSVPGEGGRLRTLTDATGQVVVERLESFDAAERTYSYSIVRSPFPVRQYRSTLRVRDLGADGARVEWSGTFVPDGVGDAEASALFTSVYRDGLAALRRALAG